MASAHPGKWRPVFVKPEEGQQPETVINTEQIAAHACVICTDFQNQKWKILYGWPTYREGENNKVQTRIWDPDPSLEDPISEQDIPDWPSASEVPAPSLFCGGQHSCLTAEFCGLAV